MLTPAIIGVVFALLTGGVLLFAFIWVRWPRNHRSGSLATQGVLHLNINCSDFERSREFYEMLGFRHVMKVAEEGGAQVAQAVGLPPYRVRGALMAHRDGTMIDLLQWQDPVDDRLPYDGMNHLGIARLALATRDLDGDMEKLANAGVEFLSEHPAEVPDPLGGTTRFICFKDPDGIVVELVHMGNLMHALRTISGLIKNQKNPQH
jgi:catechol 2,3-dioxygenase-like lactoylglutathione lyase family enzyme